MKVLAHLALWSLGLADPETQTSAAERACLVRYAKGKRRLAEIGVWHGVTTRGLRAAMAPDAVLYAIDPFPRGRLGFSAQRYIARREVAKVPNGTVRWLRSKGAEAGRRCAASRAEPFDFVFVDGDHSYEGLQGDWKAWSTLIEPGGIVALHDSRPTDGRPIQDAGSVIFTRDVILLDRRFHEIDTMETLTVLRRRTDV